MSNNYKVEWTEPTYGCCYMTEQDSKLFKSALGTPQEIYTTRHDLLAGYSNQKPFNGDGTLFYLTWDEYQKTLPLIVKVNQAMTAEKVGRYNITFGISQSVPYKQKIYGGLNGLDSVYKSNPFSMFENKSSMKRKKEEGTKADNGNILKAMSLLMTPAVTDLVSTISDEANSASLKAKSVSDSLINSAVSEAMTGINASFTSLKTSVETIKAQAISFKATIEVLKQSIPLGMAAALARGRLAAQQARLEVEEAKALLIENATMALEMAVAAIASAFASVAALVFTQLPFTNFVVDAAGGNMGTRTVDGVIQNDCPKLDEETYPAEYQSLSHRCFEPSVEGDQAAKDKAEEQARTFASRYNGHVVWLAAHERWAVFYDINAYNTSTNNEDEEEE